MVETKSRKKQRMAANVQVPSLPPKKQRMVANVPVPSLPPSVWMQVGDFLPRRDFNSLTYTCKAIHKFSQLPSVVPKWPDNVVISPCPTSKGDNGFVFSPDGKTFAFKTVDEDDDYKRNIHLWDVRRGEVPGFAAIRVHIAGLTFSPDGNFFAITCNEDSMHFIRIYRKKECCEGKLKGLDGFDPRHYRDVPVPYDFVDGLDVVVWAHDSKSFMGAGFDGHSETVRGKWDLVDGDFVPSGPLNVVGFYSLLSESEISPTENLQCLLSFAFVRSPCFDAIFRSRILTEAEEEEMMEKIFNLCKGGAEDHEIVIMFRSQSQSSVLFVQTSEAKLYALEVYCENGSYLPSFRKLAESPTFAVKSGHLHNEPGTEVPGSSVLSVLFSDKDRKNRITLYELQEKALKGVTRDCNAARLAAMANHHATETSGVTHFLFSPNGKTMVATYGTTGRSWGNPGQEDNDHCRMFSV